MQRRKARRTYARKGAHTRELRVSIARDEDVATKVQLE
jgi:hypothetical protein